MSPQINLSIPAESKYVSVVRLTASGLAAKIGFSSDDIEDIKVKYLHFPGHTPGCSTILIKDTLFSGDFIFKGSIGRVDFPFSNPDDMRESIEKFLHVQENWTIYAGHGESTTVQAEQKTLPMWLRHI